MVNKINFISMGKWMVIFTLCVIGLLLLTSSALAQSEDDGNERSESDELGWAWIGLVCLIPIVILVVFILVAIWVYKDANKRGMNGTLWLIVILVGSLIGLIIYLVIRRDHPVGSPPYGGYPPGAFPPGGYPPRGYPPPPPGQYPPR
jgi:cytochrome bd-type quinol oxidase subunit 2